MATPHRGLPPPSAMTLPEPGRGPPSIPPSLGALPPPPSSSWQGTEDSMKNWLSAKVEEDRRKQEEERTRQEGLRLEQRKIEQSMLRDSMQGGVPPHLVPLIFAGIGGGNLASMTTDWVQQYSAQLHSAQHQHQPLQQPRAQHSPDIKREARLMGQVQQQASYGATPQTPHAVLPPTSVLPGQPLPAQPQHGAYASTPYASGGIMSPRARAAQAAVPTQQPPITSSSVQQPQHSQSTTQQEQSSPSIYFHHWVPPAQQTQEKSSSGNPPATPSDYTSSPKKRKAQGGHPPPPPPTSAPQSHTSPSFSHISSSSASTPGRRGHARTRSDLSARGETHSGPVSRRGTVSSHPHAEPSYQAEHPEQRYRQPSRAAEYQHTHYAQQYDPAYAAASQHNDGRVHEQQARPEAAMAIQAETRQSVPHPHLVGHRLGSVPSSPKREAGGL